MLAKLLETKSRLLISASMLVVAGALLVWGSTTSIGAGLPGLGIALAYDNIDRAYDGNSEFGAESHGNEDLAARVGKTRCDAQVTLSTPDPHDLDIHMSLNLLLCPDRTFVEPSQIVVYDPVRGTGFYTIAVSETTEGLTLPPKTVTVAKRVLRVK